MPGPVPSQLLGASRTGTDVFYETAVVIERTRIQTRAAVSSGTDYRGAMQQTTGVL